MSKKVILNITRVIRYSVDLLEILFEELDEEMPRLKSFVNASDYNSARQSVHAIKGSAWRAGLEALFHSAELLECVLEEGKIDEIGDLLAKTVDEFEIGMNEFKAFLDDKKKSS